MSGCVVLAARSASRRGDAWRLQPRSVGCCADQRAADADCHARPNAHAHPGAHRSDQDADGYGDTNTGCRDPDGYSHGAAHADCYRDRDRNCDSDCGG